MKRLLLSCVVLLLAGCGSGLGNARTTCLGVGWTNAHVDLLIVTARSDRGVGFTEAQTLSAIRQGCSMGTADPLTVLDCVICGSVVVGEVYDER